MPGLGCAVGVDWGRVDASCCCCCCCCCGGCWGSGRIGGGGSGGGSGCWSCGCRCGRYRVCQGALGQKPSLSTTFTVSKSFGFKILRCQNLRFNVFLFQNLSVSKTSVSKSFDFEGLRFQKLSFQILAVSKTFGFNSLRFQNLSVSTTFGLNNLGFQKPSVICSEPSEL